MNLAKLKGKIAESGIKKSEIASGMGISIQALGKKLSGKTKISTDDAERLCTILDIRELSEKAEIFLS